MTNLAILHAPGDEAAAHALSTRLAAHRPVAMAVGAAQTGLRLGAHVTLLVVWSQLARSLEANREFGEICWRHSGLVMVCPIDGAALPEELDDPDYRHIDAEVDEATLETARRAHAIVEGANRKRREAIQADFARREQRSPSGQAFAGGALTGFATTVALFGAMGATAIGAVDQWTTAGDQTAELPPPDMRVLRGIPDAPDHSAWADVDPQPAPTPKALAAADQTLAAAAARIADMRAMTEAARQRLETIAEGELWSPPVRSASAAPASSPAATAPVAKPEAPEAREFAHAEREPEALEVARFALFEIEPFDFAPVSELDLGSTPEAELSLGEGLDTQMDWPAEAAMKHISYEVEPAGGA